LSYLISDSDNDMTEKKGTQAFLSLISKGVKTQFEKFKTKYVEARLKERIKSLTVS